MYTLPAASTATSLGILNSAEVAGPPSPLNPSLPLPAIVVMVPAVSTLRIRRFPASAMYTLPAGSTATPLGSYNEAEVAGPPSPLNPCLPLPAMVLMIPAVLTLRIRLPPGSTKISIGTTEVAVAGPPSPPKISPPSPATVLMIPAVFTLRTRLFLGSVMYRLPETSTARLHASNEAAVASPPSPLNPEVPLPAIVLMSPTVSTLRIRLFPRSAMYTLPAGSTATPLGPFNDAVVAG